MKNSTKLKAGLLLTSLACAAGATAALVLLQKKREEEVYHEAELKAMDELEEYVSNYHPDVAVLTVPQNVAQSLADRLIALGVRGFWNFTNVELSTDEPGVFFEDIHFVDTLLTLSYRISRP